MEANDELGAADDKNHHASNERGPTTALGKPVIAADWPHGLRCAECDRELAEGDRYSERFYGLTAPCEDGKCAVRPIVLIVCLRCALG
jgi:hypothetical protein